ncbi:MAG TPA: MarR family transcriptional regulator [Bacillales bacterium]|nr:MarR family transcriptional regulator [Bacillales bacterium]
MLTQTTQVAEIEKALRMIAGIIKQKGREILKEFDITPPQFVALQWLSEEGDLTIGELSGKMFLACSTTTDLVDRMENNGLVKRVKDENDRRVVRIHLLEKGSDLIVKAIDKRQDYLREIFEGYSKEEIDRLENSLTHLYKEIKQA